MFARNAGTGWPAYTVVLAGLGIAVSAGAQPTNGRNAALPAPTGPFSIGRVTLLCTDASRLEPLAPHGPRALMVDVWYPARSVNGTAAPYLDIKAFEQAIGAPDLRKQLGGAYELVISGVVRTHAGLGAPFARSLGRRPVLIFSPGGGMVRELYASQLEDLASHGYIVAAITHPFDGFVTILPDGGHIVYRPDRWPQQPSVEGELNLNQLEWHADDIRLVLDKLSGPDVAHLPIAGHLDLARVGAFGHSFGGFAAAHACQKDKRIKACLNQDGLAAMRPFYADARGWGMDQVFMLIERAPRVNPPSDQELAEMKLTRVQAVEMLERLKASKIRALRSTGGGSYQVRLEGSSTTHMDFSDLPFLGARDETEAESRKRVIATIRAYTRAFFDQCILHRESPLLEGKLGDQLVESVQRFGPGKRPK